MSLQGVTIPTPLPIPPNIPPILPGAGMDPSTIQRLISQASPSTIASNPIFQSGYSLPEAAAGGSRLSSLLGRGSAIASGGIEWPGTMAFLKGSAKPLLVSQLATAGINATLPSEGSAGNTRQILGDAATGAGIGAAVGSIVPGAGTTLGGVIGGVAGGAYGAFDSVFGDDESKPSTDDYKTTLLTAAQQLGVDPAQYGAAWDLLTKSGADPKQLSVQLSQQLLQDAAVQKQQKEQLGLQLQQRQIDQKFALAIQAQAAEFFAPYTNNIISAGATQAQLLGDLANQLPAAYRGVMQNQAQQALSQSQRLAGAYAAQTALIPGQFMAQAESKRQAEIQKLQYQQQVIQSQQGGGGANDYAALLQQIGGQTQTQQPQTVGG